MSRSSLATTPPLQDIFVPISRSVLGGTEHRVWIQALQDLLWLVGCLGKGCVCVILAVSVYSTPAWVLGTFDSTSSVLRTYLFELGSICGIYHRRTRFQAPL
jgi:hypothetical protein